MAGEIPINSTERTQIHRFDFTVGFLVLVMGASAGAFALHLLLTH